MRWTGRPARPPSPQVPRTGLSKYGESKIRNSNTCLSKMYMMYVPQYIVKLSLYRYVAHFEVYHLTISEEQSIGILSVYRRRKR